MIAPIAVAENALPQADAKFMIASGAKSSGPEAKWRRAKATDLEAIERISSSTHPDLLESRGVFAEKLTLFPVDSLV